MGSSRKKNLQILQETFKSAEEALPPAPNPMRTAYYRAVKFPTYRFKKRWDLFRRFSTTWTSRVIDLSQTFGDWPTDHRISNILHESQHIEQHRKWPWFKIRYLFKKHYRMDAEIDALRMNIYYWVWLDVFPHDWSRWLFTVVDNFGKNYLLGDWYDDVMQAQMAERLTRYYEEAQEWKKTWIKSRKQTRPR